MDLYDNPNKNDYLVLNLGITELEFKMQNNIRIDL